MTSTETHDDGTRKVAELLRSAGPIAMLTTRAPDGVLMSRPMALQEVEFDGDLWFFADETSHIVEHLGLDPQVNVSVSAGSTWVSLAGHGAVVRDDAKKRELWSSTVEAWFPDGPDAPHIVLVRVEAQSAEYWDTPGGRVASLVSFAKAKATGRPYSGGDNETVQM